MPDCGTAWKVLKMIHFKRSASAVVRRSVPVIARSLALVLALTWTAGVGASPPARAGQSGRSSRADQPRPNLVLITVDSLRADHLGAYGYARPTSPEIDRFARSAVVVSDGIAQAPYTKASIASLLTGLFPTAHQTYSTGAPFGVLRATGSAGDQDVGSTDTLNPAVPSLPQLLQAAGYHTIAISSNPYLIRDFGFANGFAEFRYIKGGASLFVRADEMMAAAKEAIGRAQEPYFVWIHLMDTHYPYEPPEAFRSMFRNDGSPHILAADQIPDGMSIDGSTDLNLYRSRYDAAIRSADAAIGQFLRWLETGGQWSRTGVVLTADHGDGFMEHGLMGHNNSLYDELLHVPLIVKLPTLQAGRRTAQVQLADLFPTLCAAANVVAPTGLHGRNVLPVLAGREAGEPYAYSELVGRRYALRSQDWKFIASFQGGRQLFNLADDPGETANLVNSAPATADKMERILAAALSTAINDSKHITKCTAPVSPAVLSRLQALGYVTR